jgi:hypothetical protein
MGDKALLSELVKLLSWENGRESAIKSALDGSTYPSSKLKVSVCKKI